MLPPLPEYEKSQKEDLRSRLQEYGTYHKRRVLCCTLGNALALLFNVKLIVFDLDHC